MIMSYKIKFELMKLYLLDTFFYPCCVLLYFTNLIILFISVESSTKQDETIAMITWKVFVQALKRKDL